MSRLQYLLKQNSCAEFFMKPDEVYDIKLTFMVYNTLSVHGSFFNKGPGKTYRN